MRIEYQLTRQEWAEARATLIRQLQAGHSESAYWRSWGAIFILCVMTWLMGNGNGPRRWFFALTPFIAGEWVVLSKSLSNVSQRVLDHVRWQGSVQTVRAAFAILAVLIWLGTWLSVLERLTLTDAIRQLLAPQAGWLLFLTWYLWTGISAQKKSVQKQWDESKALHPPRTAEITERGVAFWDPLRRTEYVWEAFGQRQETRNLFMLFTSAATYLILPKRAFDGELELVQARKFLGIADRPASRGFEVIPK